MTAAASSTAASAESVDVVFVFSLREDVRSTGAPVAGVPVTGAPVDRRPVSPSSVPPAEICFSPGRAGVLAAWPLA